MCARVYECVRARVDGCVRTCVYGCVCICMSVWAGYGFELCVCIMALYLCDVRASVCMSVCERVYGYMGVQIYMY